MLRVTSAAFLLLVFAILITVIQASNYDGINITTAQVYENYHNLGRIGPDAVDLNVTNITEYSQTMLVTSTVDGSFTYPGGIGVSDVFYDLTPLELNEVANAMQPSVNTISSLVNMPPSNAWTSVNMIYSGPGGNNWFSHGPLRVFIVGYTNNSISYGGYAPYPVIMSNLITSNTQTILIPKLFNVTSIYFNRTLPAGPLSVSVWDRSLINPSNVVELASLTNAIGGGFILYGPANGTTYYGLDPANVPVKYDNTGGHSLANFTLTQTSSTDSESVLSAQQLYTYSMNTMVSNALTAAFVFGIVNNTVSMGWPGYTTGNGIAPFNINYSASFSSNNVGSINKITYVSSSGAQVEGQGFEDSSGSNVVLVSPTHLKFAMVEQYENYIPPQSASLTGEPQSLAFGSPIIFNATVTYGKAPYTYNFLVYNSITDSLVTSALITNDLTSNTFAWKSSLVGSIYANVIVTDAESNTISSDYTSNIIINPYTNMQTPTISVSRNALNVGQTVAFMANVIGGAEPYTYNFLIFNSLTNNLVANFLSSSNTFSWTPLTPNTVYANVIVTDYDSNTANSLNSNNVYVANLALPSLAVSSFTFDAGQTASFNAVSGGGTPPYTYNFVIINSATGSVLKSILSTSSSSTNSVTWTIPATDGGDTFQANVIVTDNRGIVVNSIDNPSVMISNIIVEASGGSYGATSLGFNPAGTFAYVSNYYGAVAINVIDVATNSVAAANSVYPSGAITSDLIFNPSGSTAYGAAHFGDTLDVINVSTGSIYNVGMSSYPYGVAINPAGTTVYVTNYNSGNVLVVDTGTNTVIKSIGVGTNPTGVIFNKSGALAYVANSGSGTVDTINVVANAVVNTIGGFSSPQGLALSPDGSALYVTDYNDNKAFIVNTSTNTITSSIAVGGSPSSIAYNPDFPFAYVFNLGSTTVSVIDTNKKAVVDTLTICTNTFGPYGVVHPSGTFLYGICGSNGGSNVIVVSAVPYAIISNELSAGAINPASPIINSGGSITLSTNPSGGTPPYTYQWYTGSSCSNAISGATSNTYLASPASTTIYTYGLIDSLGASVCSAPDTVTVSGTSPTTTVNSGSSGGGGGGGGSSGGGGSGGGGNFAPSITRLFNASDEGWKITNMTQDNSELVGLNGSLIKITVNFISPDSAGITVGNNAYTLNTNQYIDIGNGRYIRLSELSYTPILHTVQLNVYENRSEANISSASPRTNQSILLDVSKVTGGFASFYNGRIWINVSSQSSLQHGINVSVRKIDTGALPKLGGNALIYAFNISIVPFNSTVVTVLYGQNASSNSVFPYMLANDEKWTAISQYSVNQSAGSISFSIPSDPVIGIFETVSKTITVATVNTTLKTTSIPSTISSSTTTIPQNKNAFNIRAYYEYIVAVVVIAVAAVLLYLRLKGRRGIKKASTPVTPMQPEQQNTLAPEHKTYTTDKPQEGQNGTLPPSPK